MLFIVQGEKAMLAVYRYFPLNCIFFSFRPPPSLSHHTEDGEVIDLTGEEESIEDPDYEKIILYRHKTTGYYYSPVSDSLCDCMLAVLSIVVGRTLGSCPHTFCELLVGILDFCNRNL